MTLYDAFISYSHAKDKPIAAALQSAIQKLGKPWYRRRALRLFRDDTSLAATPHLWPMIEQALGQSRHFVLLASLGGDEFKLWEVIVNMIVLTIMCVIVFKVGLSMNISIIEGIW